MGVMQYVPAIGRRWVVAGGVASLAFAFAMTSVRPAVAAPVAPQWAWLFDEADVNDTAVLDSGSAGAHADGTIAGKSNATGDLRSSSETPFDYAGNKSLIAGSMRWASVPLDASLGTSTTISAWVRYDTTYALGTPSYVFDTSDGGSGRVLWYYKNDGTPQGDAIYWNGGHPDPSGITSLDDGVWRHLVLVREGSSLSIWEGDLGQSLTKIKTVSVSGAATTISTFYMGVNFRQAEVFRGEVDEYAIWDSALSEDDLQWLHSNSLTAIPEPASIGVLVAAGAGLMLRRRRKSVV